MDHSVLIPRNLSFCDGNIDQVMKAALDEVIGTFAAQPGTAGQLWERLLSAVVVQPFTPPDHPHLGSSLHYDITYQLQEIEVHTTHLCCKRDLLVDP